MFVVCATFLHSIQCSLWKLYSYHHKVLYTSHQRVIHPIPLLSLLLNPRIFFLLLSEPSQSRNNAQAEGVSRSTQRAAQPRQRLGPAGVTVAAACTCQPGRCFSGVSCSSHLQLCRDFSVVQCSRFDQMC